MSTEVLEELRVDSHRSVLASEGIVPGPSGTVIRRSHHTVRSKRSTKTDPFPPLPSDLPMLQPGFSSTGATQLPFFRRKFRPVNFQARWSTYGM